MAKRNEYLHQVSERKIIGTTHKVHLGNCIKGCKAQKIPWEEIDNGKESNI